ncbi:MAG: sulfurtransferase TusA [Oleiphilaceae bacterium]|nr:sulfurtransferase TusA [Oleiphilaceae bacterium]
MEHQHDLNAEGLYCPEPVMMLHAKVADMAAGEVLRVTATDPSTQRDIPQFCRMLGHTLLSAEQEDSIFVYLIQKSG